MNPDLFLVLGIVVAGFSIPSVLSAITDGRAPRASAVTILIAGGLVLYAMQTKQGGYALSDIPDAFVRVAAQIMP
ncbi:hypothetical protein [uncultured Tateyamaria sp.]|uniref:hypothetical protein n=1 Tax=Tateyamaria sp. 1078 TaxID=3417464 RepID=UPI002606A11A|nr:hypothetical protein [uncultured Tateyamaria sp.]